ncbi:MAG: hypothetical protein EPO21_17385 [Chloroflexota bacterium]|nr:MAG: hypothetical protein EPO21_17385 [Chloroflexota bacterium]
MDLLLICSTASAASLAANLLWATEARKAGMNPAVMFTAEALAALGDGTFVWPRGLSHQGARLTIADSAKRQGLPIMLRGEARQLDFHSLFARAQEEGVPMYADPVWTELLALSGRLPVGVEEIDASKGLRILSEARTIIGGL